MNRTTKYFLVIAGLYSFCLKAFAVGTVIHYQGNVDDREIFFADMRVVSNRTPTDKVMGATEIREIDVTAVYENANKPEFVHMKLQFECPNAFFIDMKTHELNEQSIKVKAGDSVKFRIGSGSYSLRRSDLQSEVVPVSDWRISNAPMLSKAGALACNHLEFDKVIRASIIDNKFDMDSFHKSIAKFGFSSDLMLIDRTLPPEFLDFAWTQFWYEKVIAGKRPDPSGKWARKVTDAEKQAAISALEKMQKALQPDIDAAQQNLLDGIKKSKADMAARAATRPDGKELTPIESNLLILWKGRSESDVVNVMGNPDFNEAGGFRFLRYTKSWEKAGFTAFSAKGAVVGGDPGGYAECFVEFKTKQDEKGVWIVEDILVRSDYADDGLGRTRGLCQDLAIQAAH